MAEVPVVESADGFKMPLIGYGTWQAAEAELENALDCALETGYRHIDTAFVYRNENVVGNVLKKWFDAGKLTREDVFITTKLPVHGNRAEHVQKFMDLSLQNLQMTYVDLYLIHVPFGVNYHGDDEMYPITTEGLADFDDTTDHLAIWKEMENQVTCGKTRAIGVSNFSISQVDRILKNATIRPVTNQVQMNVYYQQPDLVKYLKDNGIIITSYSTLGCPGLQGLFDACNIEKEIIQILEIPTVLEIANETDKTPAQVLLRHMVQKDIVVIPKSVTPERIKNNFELLDFELTELQMEKLDDLNINLPVFKFSDFFKGIEKHPEYHFDD